MAAMIPNVQKDVKEFRAQHGETKVGEVNVNMVGDALRPRNEPSTHSVVLCVVKMYGGMRGIRGLVTETSLLDPEEASFD